MLANFDYRTLEFLKNYPEEISDSQGIYYWVYWPIKESDLESIDKFVLKITEFSKINLNIAESYSDFKYEVTVRERLFPNKDNSLLGLSPSKREKLISYLESNENRQAFLNYLKDICFTRPFYIGKANNLKNRLNQHFAGNNSNILYEISKLDIKFSDIWIGYKTLHMKNDEEISNIFEEVMQRIVKPGLTKRPG